MTNYLLAPSIIASDFAHIADEVKACEIAGADWIHVDVMDGQFVPTISVGPLFVESLRRTTKLPLDVHLMISEPEKHLEDFAKAGASSITVHTDGSGFDRAKNLELGTEGPKNLAVSEQLVLEAGVLAILLQLGHVGHVGDNQGIDGSAADQNGLAVTLSSSLRQPLKLLGNLSNGNRCAVLREVGPSTHGSLELGGNAV